MLERLQKILSARGIASRRKAEEYIEQGLVKVNGVVAKVGDKADPEKDTIEVSGKVLEDRAQMQYFLMNKPVGVETTSAETAENAVINLLPPELRGKIYPVGRLDKDSSGLLLFTNDGALAFRLTHPKFEHEKEYEVETTEEIKDGALLKIRQGVKIDNELTKPSKIQRTGPKSFRIILTEGRYRQIRRMVQKVGSEVKHLHRIRITSLSDSALAEGKIRPLTEPERVAILKSVGIE